MIRNTPSFTRFTIGKPLILVFVGRSLEGGASDVYHAARGGWRMRAGDPPSQHRGPVLARDSQRVLGAFRPRRWYADPNDGGRWYFDGEPADFATQLRYVGIAVPDCWCKSRTPVSYCNPQPA